MRIYRFTAEDQWIPASLPALSLVVAGLPLALLLGAHPLRRWRRDAVAPPAG